MEMLTLEQKSDNYTELLSVAATTLGCVFYGDCGEGHDLETDTVYYEDVSGWLIPVERREEFESTPGRNGSIWKDSKWDEFFVFAEWRKDGDDIKIDFKKYPVYT